MQANDLHNAAAQKGQLDSPSYKAQQADLYEDALQLVNGSATDD